MFSPGFRDSGMYYVYMYYFMYYFFCFYQACVFIWILLIMYKSGLVQHVFQMESENANITTPPLSQILVSCMLWLGH